MKKEVGKRIAHREVGPFLQWLRERCLGRELKTNKRFSDELSDRTQPLPNLPLGPSHQLSANYYFLRDARRRVPPPLYISGPDEQKKLAAGMKREESPVVVGAKGVTPGFMYDPEAEPRRGYRTGPKES